MTSSEANPVDRVRAALLKKECKHENERLWHRCNSTEQALVAYGLKACKRYEASRHSLDYSSPDPYSVELAVIENILKAAGHL